jgi:tetratricopeptide (TPR) repeat protein
MNLDKNLAGVQERPFFARNCHKVKRLSCLLLVLTLVLAGCSTDPNKQKRAYLNSGERYAKAGKYREAVIQFRNAVQIDPRLADAHWQLAGAYARLGNSEAAYREVTETVSLDPKNRDAQLQLSMLLLGRRQYDQAQAAAQRAIQLDPNNARAHAILGQKFISTHDWPSAIRELQKAVAADPQRAESYGALGAAYLAAGQLSEAEAAYRKGVVVNPKSVQAHVSLAEFCVSQHRMAEAEDEMRAAAALDAHAVHPRLFLARILIARGRSADAEKILADLRTVVPQDPQAYQALGLYYRSTGQKEKAAAEFQSLLIAKPKDGSVKANLVETLIDLSRIKEAGPLNQGILDRDPGDPQALLSQSRILIAESKWQEAAGDLQKVIKSEPNSAAAYYYLGIAQKSLGFLDLARESFKRSLQLAPGSAAAAALSALDLRHGQVEEALRLAGGERSGVSSSSAELAQARALLAQGDTRGAEAAVQTVLKRDPLSLPALATLLNTYARQGKASQAAERFSALVQQYPQNASLHFLLALAYFDAKDLPSAEASVREAVRLDAKTPQAYSLLANIDLARGEAEAAEQDFRRAIAADPRNVRNYLSLESVYERKQNWEEAKKLAEQAHEIDSNSPQAAGTLAFLYLEHGGDVNVAVSLAEAVKEKMPDSPIAADTLGWAYYKLGSYDAAVAQLQGSVHAAPKNPMYRYHLGLALWGAHHFDQARLSLQQALHEDPHGPYAALARQDLSMTSQKGQ